MTFGSGVFGSPLSQISSSGGAEYGAETKGIGCGGEALSQVAQPFASEGAVPPKGSQAIIHGCLYETSSWEQNKRTASDILDLS